MAQKKFHRQQKRPETLPMAPTSTPSAALAVAGALELAQRARAPAGAVTERQRDVEDIEAAEAPAERSAAAVPWGCRGMDSVGAQRRGGVWGVLSPMNRSRRQLTFFGIRSGWTGYEEARRHP